VIDAETGPAAKPDKYRFVHVQMLRHRLLRLPERSVPRICTVVRDARRLSPSVGRGELVWGAFDPRLLRLSQLSCEVT
jgi:hypothetical protein